MVRALSVACSSWRLGGWVGRAVEGSANADWMAPAVGMRPHISGISRAVPAAAKHCARANRCPRAIGVREAPILIPSSADTWTTESAPQAAGLPVSELAHVSRVAATALTPSLLAERDRVRGGN
jgi:hypothetical protein